MLSLGLYARSVQTVTKNSHIFYCLPNDEAMVTTTVLLIKSPHEISKHIGAPISLSLSYTSSKAVRSFCRTMWEVINYNTYPESRFTIL